MRILFIFFSILLLSCTSEKKKAEKTAQYSFDLQGHRGARGLMPENTISAFLKALDLGVNTIELDVVISKDKKVVVSHEPWFNSDISLTPAGNKISKEKEKSYNFYEMKYDEIKAFDCGSILHPDFPKQELIKSYKPLLSEVLHILEEKSKKDSIKLSYNIEIKSMPVGDNLFHPVPSEYVKLVLDVVQNELGNDRFNIQSFDFRILREIHQQAPTVKLSMLVSEGDLETHLSELGFIPTVYSPYYKSLDSITIAKANKMQMKVIPWTVNEIDDMLRLLKWNVSGIITDYPDRALPLRK